MYPLIALLLASVAFAAPNCPPLGPVFEPPTNLLANDAIRAAIANLTSTFQARDADNSTGAFSTSYSLEVFSTASDSPLVFSWHHTAPNLTYTPPSNSSNSTGAPYSNTSSTTAAHVGVSKVDGNTVYRLGSLTKIFTILTWLVQDGDAKWNEPITKYVPELAAVADRAKSDPVSNVAWGDVTIGALASQLSGAVRDCKSLPWLHLWDWSKKC
jgi:hypothetical protein